MKAHIKTDGTVDLTLTRDQFDTLRRLAYAYVGGDRDMVKLSSDINNEDQYTYQVTEEIYGATESFLRGLIEHYKTAEGVDAGLIRQIIADAALNVGTVD